MEGFGGGGEVVVVFQWISAHISRLLIAARCSDRTLDVGKYLSSRNQ